MVFNKQKFFIALICTVIGWSIGYQMGKKKAEEENAQQGAKFGISQFFGIPFSGSQFGTPDNEQAPKSLFDRFFGGGGQGDFKEEDGSLFDNPFSLFGQRTTQPSVNTREDENFVYMEIDLESFDKNSMSARVEDGAVVIEGTQKSEGQGSSVSSHFYQSFPAPMGTDASKVDMVHENNKLVLKFPKLKR
jgi:HSP20 family molecular chaperone IbpA